MLIKLNSFIKTIVALLIVPASSVLPTPRVSQKAMIIDHACTDIKRVPVEFIGKAKSEFRIAYGHTSHGSQIVSGMTVLMEKSGLYSFNQKGKEGALFFLELKKSGDLANPDRTEWYHKTRKLLNKRNNSLNVIVWAWCGGVSTASENDIKIYLDLMSRLERDYPQIIFVYMTGHLDGTGEEGNLNVRNNQIREFCTLNGKVLFDFADIESYDPDGNYFLDKQADDGCYYMDNGVQKNWAEEWCQAHPGMCSSCSCAHSHSLICDLKGKAFWWMLARLTGWASE
jgi:hypothetical protein